MIGAKNYFRYIWKKMKSKDIQKPVKSNWLRIMNDRAFHPTFSSLRPIKKDIPTDAA